MFNLKITKMKKITLIAVTVFLNAVLFSCTPEALETETINPQATGDEDPKPLCCDEDGDIDPPPPPPEDPEPVDDDLNP